VQQLERAAMPALLTSASSRPGDDSPPPPSSLTRAAALRICSKSVTSSEIGSIRPDGAFAASRAPSSSLRTPASTFHPAPARRSAVASPIPLDAPVISALGIAESYLTASLGTT
jgi:hypothetical protein